MDIEGMCFLDRNTKQAASWVRLFIFTVRIANVFFNEYPLFACNYIFPPFNTKAWPSKLLNLLGLLGA